ncbi:MAG: LysR family transcriptional regulator [Verrucomicrobia bacterium]|nr:LysR family transcriptional regulator [Verrucomicrobiota bacterium]
MPKPLRPKARRTAAPAPTTPASLLPRFKDVSFRQMIGFYEAARLESFEAAAEFLGLSRPSVWMQVRSLEREFKATLLKKDGRRLRLTAEGRRLSELVRPLVDGFAAVKAEFKSAAGPRKEQHHLRLVTTPSLIANELRQPITELVRRDPSLCLHVSDRGPEMSMHPLLEGKVDLAIVGFLKPPPRIPGVGMELLTNYPMTLICPAHHPFAKARKLDFRQVARSRLILSLPHTNPRVRVEAFFAELGVVEPLQVVFEALSSAYIASSVDMGLGVCITSVSPLQRNYLMLDRAWRNKIHIRDLSADMGVESVYCLWRLDRPEPPWQEEFRRLLKTHMHH